MTKLTLYITQGCPFSRKVLTYMEKSNIVVPIKDINESSQNRQELLDIGGKGQVPCLVIDDKALYESDDIIQWFQDNWKESEPR